MRFISQIAALQDPKENRLYSTRLLITARSPHFWTDPGCSGFRARFAPERDRERKRVRPRLEAYLSVNQADEALELLDEALLRASALERMKKTQSFVA